MRHRWLLAFLLTLGCETPGPAPTRESKVEPTLSLGGQASGKRVQRGTELAFRWRQVHGRLSEEMPRPESFEGHACPDDRIRRDAPSAPARTLTLDLVDARFDAHSLLPVIVTRSLQSPHVERLEGFLQPSSNADSASFSFSSPDAAERAEGWLAALDQRVYKGVFFVIQYKKPHLIRKKGKRRREWLPGLLQAWLVVYDIDTSEALCSTRIVVTSDVDDAPVWLRTMAGTQKRLIGELGQTMLREGRRSLASISSTLTIEVSDDARPVATALMERD